MSAVHARTQNVRVEQSPSRVLRQSLQENGHGMSRFYRDAYQPPEKRKPMSSPKRITPAKKQKRTPFTLKTPVHTLTKHKTPTSRRVIATPRVHPSQQANRQQLNYEGILKKQWRTYSVSPLYNFKTAQTLFTKYERSLDAAICQELSSKANPLNTGAVKSHFSLYQGLKFHDDDPDAVQIQMTEKNVSGSGSSIVFQAFLICLGLSESPVPPNVKDRFTYYPLLLVAGTKNRTGILLDWLERHFDCRTSPLTFSDTDLRWMLASGTAYITDLKPPPILLQYSVSDVCDGISTIDCKFEASFCKELWRRLLGDSRQEMNEDEVVTFINTLEEHLERSMHIVFKKLNLSEVGTSVAYISSLGKIKIFSRDALFSILHLICDIANDRFTQFSLETS